MNFRRERAHDVFEEMKPLFQKHWEEISFYKDIPLDPDFSTYLKMEDAGVLRVFTAREDDGTLVGYQVYFIKHNLHYKSSLQALQDIIFIDPSKRGMFGAKFIFWAEEQLKSYGVQLVCQHLKVATPKTIELFKRLGYSEIDLIMGKRLDGGG